MALLVASAAPLSARSAEVTESHLNEMRAAAKSAGSVAVVIDLERVGLSSLNSDMRRLNLRLQAKTTALMTELGAQAVLGAPHWRNNAGQIEVEVTLAGLNLLRDSSLALGIRPGRGALHRHGLDHGDGRLQALEVQLRQHGQVEVELLPAGPDVVTELSRQGGMLLRGSAGPIATGQVAALLRTLPSQDVVSHRDPLQATSAAATSDTQTAPLPRVILTRQGVLRLAATGQLQGLMPAGHRDKRPLQIDPEALRAVKQAGTVDVVVTLRSPALSGSLLGRALENLRTSQRHALVQVLAQAGVDSSGWRDFSAFGSMAGPVSLQQLTLLQQQADPRLLSVELNKPAATTQLAASTTLMNLPGVWSRGYRAAGQNIVVIDSGTQADHPFLRNAAGTSRVIAQACFGSNSWVDGVLYGSACPNAMANGDSPEHTAGAAVPLSNCSALNPDSCAHGTHVTGIAAGRSITGAGSGVQGVAPDAQIVAVNVFSYDVNRLLQPQAFTEDIVAAMNTLVTAVGTNEGVRPHTVNLSVGSGLYSGPCPNVSPAFTQAVASLRALGIPVLAATGNRNVLGSVSWPACVPGVIQVSAVNNDGHGNARSVFGTAGGVTTGANLARPAQFPGATMWMAPGGGGGTAVRSSVLNAGYGWMAGTSQASPHATGLYAVAKAAMPASNVDEVTEWLVTNASVMQYHPMCTEQPCNDLAAVPRLRAPSLQ